MSRFSPVISLFSHCSIAYFFRLHCLHREQNGLSILHSESIDFPFHLPHQTGRCERNFTPFFFASSTNHRKLLEMKQIQTTKNLEQLGTKNISELFSGSRDRSRQADLECNSCHSGSTARRAPYQNHCNPMPLLVANELQHGGGNKQNHSGNVSEWYQQRKKAPKYTKRRVCPGSAFSSHFIARLHLNEMARCIMIVFNGNSQCFSCIEGISITDKATWDCFV